MVQVHYALQELAHLFLGQQTALSQDEEQRFAGFIQDLHFLQCGHEEKKAEAKFGS